jgi:hypothetical protein
MESSRESGKRVRKRVEATTAAAPTQGFAGDRMSENAVVGSTLNG